MGMEFMKLISQFILMIVIFSCGEDKLSQKLAMVNGKGISLFEYKLRYENYLNDLFSSSAYLLLDIPIVAI